jgi:hypothetical protein
MSPVTMASMSGDSPSVSATWNTMRVDDDDPMATFSPAALARRTHSMAPGIKLSTSVFKASKMLSS